MGIRVAVTESQSFALKHFYYGLLVQDGKPVGSQPGVVGCTPGLTEGIVQECLRMAPLPPPTPAEQTPEMPGAIGMFRASTTSFVLAKSRLNEAGFPQIMYCLVPVDNLRHLGGNVMALSTFAKRTMPAFATPQTDLAPFIFDDISPQNEDDQITALCNLVFECQDSLDAVEHILGGLVQGNQVIIANSPANIDLRLHFLQGLINMIPHPAQASLTYATHFNLALPSPALIKFASTRVIPENHLVYDWGTGELLTEPPTEAYSRYIVSQLRLDPALVVQQTSELGRTMIWRASQQDSLSTALAWVSRRAAVDQAVRLGQPADRETVAAILREDPTLSDDARKVYARHVLAFALALNEPLAADVIPVTSAQHPTVANVIREQLETAISKGQAHLVYQMIEHWMLHIESTSSFQWQALLHKAARQHLVDLLQNGATEQALRFLEHAQSAPSALQLQGALGHLIEAAIPYSVGNPSLARTIFLSAVRHLPAGQFQRLTSQETLSAQLPPETRNAIRHLTHAQVPAPPHVLTAGASVYDIHWRSLVLSRLIEWAAFLQRFDLIDSSALAALQELTKSPRDAQFATLIQNLAGDLADSPAIRTLDASGQRILIQLLIQTHQEARAVGLLEYYQESVYGPGRSAELGQLTTEVFRLPSVDAKDMVSLLELLDTSQIRADARARAYLSVLELGQWAKSYEYAARRLTGALFTDYQLLRFIGTKNALKLLDFYYHLRNPLDALRVATALTDYLADKPKESSALMVQMWPLITWNAETTEAATELLRRHVRHVPASMGPQMVDYFAKAIGQKTGQVLQATHIMRVVMGEFTFEQWAEAIHITAQMFIDIAAVYHSQKELPPKHRLRRDLDTMSGGLTSADRSRIAGNMAVMTRQIYELGHTRTTKRSRPPVEEQLVLGQIGPRNGIDLLRLIGGHFSEHEIFPLDLERGAMAHVFGSRSASMFLHETTTITAILNGLDGAFSTKDTATISPEALVGELESLWNTLSLFHQRRLQKQLAKDCQQLADVISNMSDRGNDKLFAAKGIGQQLETGQRQPHTSLEALRWITGYFERKHEQN